MKSLLKVALLVSVLLAIYFAAIEFEVKYKNTENEQPKVLNMQMDVVVDAPQMVKDYREGLTLDKYTGKSVEVNGVIKNVKKNFVGNWVIELHGLKRAQNVQAQVLNTAVAEAKAQQLKTEMAVTLQCQSAGEVLALPMLHDCIVK